MLHVAPLSQDTLPRNRPIQKDLPTAPRLSFSPGRQNILLFIGLAEENSFTARPLLG
jgi:hypothetical protein